MKRVALLCEVLAPPLDEGIRLVAARLAGALASRTEVILAGEKEATLGELQVSGALTDRMFHGRPLADLLERTAPDAILYVPWTSLTARTFYRLRSLRRRRHGVPLGVVALQPRGTGWMVRAMARVGAPDVAFVLGPDVEREARALGLDVVRLEGGVDPRRFRPPGADPVAELRRRLGLPASAYVVLHVGHLKRGRGIMSLTSVQALEGVQAVLVASSSTDQDHALRARLQGAGVRVVDRYVESIEDYYRAADAYLFPVRSSLDSIELPLSVLEAMACNLPLVCTRFGGLPALLEGAGPGVRWIDSVEEIPRAVAALRRDRPDPGLRERVRELTWAAMATRVLEELASRGRGR